MSLFKLKNLWSQSFPNEEFDEKHLAIGEIDNKPAIALGSFKGTLRIYQIKVRELIEVTLIYENTFQSPIISVQFVQHPEQQRSTVGVLLFKKFIYISLHRKQTEGSYSSKNISVQCEPAFKIEATEPLCLLTLNSSIQYLNPMSIFKIKQSDPIYPCACYNKNGRKSIFYGDGQQLVLLRSGVEQWRIILGQIRQIQIFRKGKTKNDQQETVVIFGSNNLWQVCDAQINRSKIIQDDLICGVILQNHSENQQEFYNIAIVNTQLQILIYTRNYTLIWAMKCENTPIQLNIIQHQNLKGAFVILSEEGYLEICYAGTELSETQIQTLKLNQDINMDVVDSETRHYLQIKRRKKQNPQDQQQIQSATDKNANARINVRAMIPSASSEILQTQYKLWQKNGGFWCCEIQCEIFAQKQSLSNFHIQITFPSNIHCQKTFQTIPFIKNKQLIKFHLFCSNQKFPHDSSIQIIAKYQLNDRKKSINVIKKQCRLPTDFQCQFLSVQLLEKAQNKIVLDSKKQLPFLCKIFPQFESKLKDSKNMTIQFPNGIQSSIGYNKNFNKIKIQSNFFSGLCYLAMVFLARLTQINEIKNQNYCLVFEKQLPLLQLMTVMKQHHDQRIRLKEHSRVLQEKSDEFRSAEKRLLLKLKEKMTTSNHIEKLLDYTYRKLMEAADKYQKTRQKISIVNHNLEIGAKFISQLLFLKYQVSQNCKKKILGIIGYQEEAIGGDYGWEEKIMGNSSFFLSKSYNYLTDKYTFEQVYKMVQWVVAKVDAGQWRE